MNDDVRLTMTVRVADILSGEFVTNILRPRGWVLAITGCLFAASPAFADLKLCNTTSSRIGVVIGYKGLKGWTSEGWWNIPSDVCWTLIKGDLAARYYYVHAVDYDQPGVWDRNEQIPARNSEFFMCTEDKAFEIRGSSRCQTRGFNRTRFFEIDTKDETSWTITLQDKVEQRAKNQ
jgi:uncharacterized membrane protein